MTALENFCSAACGRAPSDNRSNDPNCYVLIDHAGAPGLLVELRRSPAIHWWSLFDESKEQSALDVAPILAKLPHARPRSSADEFLRWVHRTCEFSTSVIVLHSNWTPGVLAAALKRRFDVVLPDHVPVMLRYFDTRVLESLLCVLAEPQRDEFMGVASRWYWLDRAGQLQTRPSRELQADPWPQRFELDVEQQNALIDAGHADALVERMNAQAPDLCQGTPRAELHSLATLCLAKLDKLHIEDARTDRKSVV